LSRRLKPTARPSKLLSVLLTLALVTAAFATLMVRLEVTQEGYRISALRVEMSALALQNQRLRLEAAQLSSRHRLRTLAVRYGLAAPVRGRLVMLP
jgi:cell division protein FtsL